MLDFFTKKNEQLLAEKDKEIESLKHMLEYMEPLAKYLEKLREKEEAIEAKEARANEMLKTAQEREELTIKNRKQYLDENKILQFQVRNLVALLKKKRASIGKSLQKAVRAGKLTKEERRLAMIKLDQEIKEALEKRPPNIKIPLKPAFEYGKDID